MSKNFISRRVILLLIVSFFSLVNIRCQDIQFPSYGDYKIVSDYPVYTSDDLWDYINGAAESYISLGFEELYIAEYKKGKGVTVKAEIYKHVNPSMAFGIYSLERSPTYNFIDIGAQGYRDEDMVHFFKDRYYIKVTTHSKSKRAGASVFEIARIIANSIEGTDEMPPALAMFPQSGRLPNEEMYISESVLGHEFLHSAFKAAYSVNGEIFAIYLFNEGDEQANREMLKIYLGKHGLDPGDSQDGKFMFEDGYNGIIFLAWKSDKTVLLSGLKAENATMANEYLNQILK